MSNCIDQELGSLIAAFELNQLEDPEKLQFEDHLHKCEHCRGSLIEMAPVLMDMKNKEGVFAEETGTSFSELANELIAESKKKTILDKAKGMIDKIKGIDYSSWLDFDPLPLPAVAVRGEKEDTYWKTAYKKGDYKIAIKYLRKVIKQSSDDWEPQMFLGICLFMDKQSNHAVKVLRKTAELSGLSMQEEIKWYLAQSLVLNGQLDEAMPILEWLVAQPGKDIPDKARSLLTRL